MRYLSISLAMIALGSAMFIAPLIDHPSADDWTGWLPVTLLLFGAAALLYPEDNDR